MSSHGPGSRAAGPAIAFKLIEPAQDRWRAVRRRPGHALPRHRSLALTLLAPSAHTAYSARLVKHDAALPAAEPERCTTGRPPPPTGRSRWRPRLVSATSVASITLCDGRRQGERSPSRGIWLVLGGIADDE